MQSRKSHKVGLVGLALVLAVAAPAFAKNARTFHLNYNAFLNGTQLKEGAYKVQWESHSPEVTVTFFHGKKTVASAEGRWMDRDAAAPANTIVYDTNPDGSQRIIEIRLAGSKQVIVFGESSSPSEAAQPGSTKAAPQTTSPRTEAARPSRIRFVGKPTVRARTPYPIAIEPLWAPYPFNFRQPVSPAQGDLPPRRAFSL